jgi:CoA:oxalate CoA-transferase
MSASGGPLDGIRVLDLSRVLAGPHCGRMLVDLGADVIKAEPPEGDMTRFDEPRVNSLSPSFVQQNCGKRNISVDLRKPEARELLARIAENCDVLLENFRPGVMERLGLGYERLAEKNPRLVYASISGYGQEGAWSGRRAYAPLVAAEVGFLDMYAYFQQKEVKQEVYSHADLYAGLECLSAILAALYQRERDGRGQRVEVSLAGSLLCINEFAGHVLSGFVLEARRRPATVSSPVFETGEGHKVTVGGDPIRPENFANWCRAMDRPDLLGDARFVDEPARDANRLALMAMLEEWVSAFSDLDELGHRLEEGGLAYGVVRTVAEIGNSDWAKEHGAVAEVSDRGSGQFRIPNSPWRFSNAASGVRGEPAYRGEHNREVLAEILGLSTDEIEGLERRGVLSQRGPSRTGG